MFNLIICLFVYLQETVQLDSCTGLTLDDMNVIIRQADVQSLPYVHFARGKFST